MQTYVNMYSRQGLCKYQHEHIYQYDIHHVCGEINYSSHIISLIQDNKSVAYIQTTFDSITQSI